MAKKFKHGEEAQEAKNYFRVPNAYQDALCGIAIPGTARQILSAIERLTLGWNKREAAITYTTFRKMTGLCDRSISKAKNILLEMRIIHMAHKGHEKSLTYRIEMDYTRWRSRPKRAITAQVTSRRPTRAIKHGPQRPSQTAHKGHTIMKKDSIKDSIKDMAKINLTLEELKTRARELKEDYTKWLQDNPGQTNNTFLAGIKYIEEEIKEFKRKEADVA